MRALGSAPDTPRQDARCVSIGAHLARVMLYGWCPCGWNGDPRTEAEFNARREAALPKDDPR